jgi:GNAT superfamily N-acetyltransferase
MHLQNKIEVRFAQETDISTIYNFIVQLAHFEKLEHEVVGSEEDIKKALFGKRPACEAILATIDSKPVGFALFFHNYSTFMARRGIYLEDIFVSQDARGLGAGKALLQFLAAIALERGCGRMEWSVLDWNQNAIDFYKTIGAKPMSEWTSFQLDEDAISKLAENGKVNE